MRPMYNHPILFLHKKWLDSAAASLSLQSLSDICVLEELDFGSPGIGWLRDWTFIGTSHFQWTSDRSGFVLGKA